MSEGQTPEPGLPEERRIDPLPERPDAADRPRIGVDEWVAQVERRRESRPRIVREADRLWNRLPIVARVAVFAVPAALFPLVSSGGNIYRYGIITLLYALLGLGLNVVVGYAGLLDLGYMAFFGFGAYGYGVLASQHSGHHWSSELAIPVVVLATALLGLLLGLPSRRLLGDYLAIVTLFFGQAFVVFANNANRIKFPHWGYVDLTGGPNGLTDIDPLDIFGMHIETYRGYFYVALVAVTLIMLMLYLVNDSRTGRAWRALREDPLAAELMTMPVNRLKLLAFAFGAAVAGLSGSIYGAVQTGAFPGDFDVTLLITVYAIVILGGAGSLGGVVIGAIIVNVVPELLRSSINAEWLFYGSILLALAWKLRPWRRFAAVVTSLVVLGLAFHAVVDAVWSRGTAGHPRGGGAVARLVEHWMILPRNPTTIANVAFFVLIVGILAVLRLRGLAQLAALVPLLYLSAFVWENRLLAEVSGATPLILLGALLIVLMNARPQGLFGTARVEIV